MLVIYMLPSASCLLKWESHDHYLRKYMEFTLSLELYHRMALEVDTNILMEYVTSIFRVESIHLQN